MNLIRTQCPNCHTELEVESTYLGEEVECPNCNMPFRVTLSRIPVQRQTPSQKSAIPPSFIKIGTVVLVGIIALLGYHLYDSGVQAEAERKKARQEAKAKQAEEAERIEREREKKQHEAKIREARLAEERAAKEKAKEMLKKKEAEKKEPVQTRIEEKKDSPKESPDTPEKSEKTDARKEDSTSDESKETTPKTETTEERRERLHQQYLANRACSRAAVKAERESDGTEVGPASKQSQKTTVEPGQLIIEFYNDPNRDTRRIFIFKNSSQLMSEVAWNWSQRNALQTPTCFSFQNGSAIEPHARKGNCLWWTKPHACNCYCCRDIVYSGYLSGESAAQLEYELPPGDYIIVYESMAQTRSTLLRSFYYTKIMKKEGKGIRRRVNPCKGKTGFKASYNIL